jgi:hypothetical protein
MRKMIMILGTILITAMVLISGSAVATWVHVTYFWETNTTNPGNIDGAPDGTVASLGKNVPPPTLGSIHLDLGPSNAMPNSQDFTVFAGSIVNETYYVYVGETSDVNASSYIGTGWDTENLTFQTPSMGDGAWRYIFLEGITGALSTDPGPGPEIDAVGWDKP